MEPVPENAKFLIDPHSVPAISFGRPLYLATAILLTAIENARYFHLVHKWDVNEGEPPFHTLFEVIAGSIDELDLGDTSISDVKRVMQVALEVLVIYEDHGRNRRILGDQQRD